MSEAAALEIGRSPRTTDETVDRVQRNGSTSLGYPTLSLTFIPSSTSALAPCRAGRGSTCAASASRRSWRRRGSRERAKGFVGTTSVTLPDAPEEPELVIRAIRPAGRPTAPVGWVVVDLPLDAAMLNKLYQRTGVKAGLVTLSHTNEDRAVSIVGGQQQTGKKKPVDLCQHGHALRQLRLEHRRHASRDDAAVFPPE